MFIFTKIIQKILKTKFFLNFFTLLRENFFIKNVKPTIYQG